MVGNVLALGQLLDPKRRATLERETNDVFVRTAVAKGGLANWPSAEGETLVSKRDGIRVRWCHGAPGIVAGAVEYLDEDEDMLLSGAELTWAVGPHRDERAPRSATGLRATATPSWRRSSGRETSAGALVRVVSRFTRSSRYDEGDEHGGAAAARSSPGTSASLSISPTVSMREPRSRCSTAD